MTERIILGNLGGGVYGLKVSLPGFSVLTSDPDDPEQTSFYSQWTDVMSVLSIGYGSSNSNLPTDVAVPDPGFIPWIEARTISGTTVYDERTPFAWNPAASTPSYDGLGIGSKRGKITLPGTPIGSPISYTIIYAVFNLAVPTQ